MTFLRLFLTFLKIGAFTFGGGYAMLPLIEAENAAQGWMQETQLLDLVAISESTPGPIAVNIATFVGMRIGGLAGALCATAGVVLPSFVIILLAAKGMEKYRESLVVRGCMAGLKPAVVGLIGAAFLTLGAAVFLPQGFGGIRANAAFFLSLTIFLLCVVLSLRKVHPILLICLSAALGIAGGYIFSI